MGQGESFCCSGPRDTNNRFECFSCESPKASKSKSIMNSLQIQLESADPSMVVTASLMGSNGKLFTAHRSSQSGIVTVARWTMNDDINKIILDKEFWFSGIDDATILRSSDWGIILVTIKNSDVREWKIQAKLVFVENGPEPGVFTDIDTLDMNPKGFYIEQNHLILLDPRGTMTISKLDRGSENILRLIRTKEIITKLEVIYLRAICDDSGRDGHTFDLLCVSASGDIRVYSIDPKNLQAECCCEGNISENIEKTSLSLFINSTESVQHVRRSLDNSSYRVNLYVGVRIVSSSGDTGQYLMQYQILQGFAMPRFQRLVPITITGDVTSMKFGPFSNGPLILCDRFHVYVYHLDSSLRTLCDCDQPPKQILFDARNHLYALLPDGELFEIPLGRNAWQFEAA